VQKVKIAAPSRKYEVFIGSGLLRNISPIWPFRGKKAGIVTHSFLSKRYGKVIKKGLTSKHEEIHFFTFLAGERSKSFRSAIRLYELLAQNEFSRDDILVAFGGGVLGDLVGFVASTYMRGVSYVQIPTTFLAQVDSSIGGKTALNLPFGKNLVGTFYQPSLVISDVTLLSTLPRRDFRSGLTEVIKTAFLFSPALLDMVERNLRQILSLRKKEVIEEVVAECVKLKGKVVEEDELDARGVRALLNYGHTFGHALEKAYGFGYITHGEAVSIGMIVAGKISHALGYLNKQVLERHIRILKKANLPVEIPSSLKESIFEALKWDKKRFEEKLNLILLKDVGKPFIKTLTLKELESLWKKLI
jgi:3-dehydroquinate synthase